MHFTTYMNLNTQDNINYVKHAFCTSRKPYQHCYIFSLLCILEISLYTFISGQSCYYIYIRMLSGKIAARRKTRSQPKMNETITITSYFIAICFKTLPYLLRLLPSASRLYQAMLSILCAGLPRTTLI